MRKKIIVWSSIICLVVLLVVISSIWQYNDKKPKYKYYINDEKYTSERCYNAFHSYDGTFSDEALNANKYFITTWAPKDMPYKRITGDGNYGYVKDKKLYSNYCYLEDLYSIYFRAEFVTKPFRTEENYMYFNFNLLESYYTSKMTGKYHMYGLENYSDWHEPQNIIHYEFDPSQKNMTFKTQYGCVEDSNYLSDIYFKFDKDFIDFPYDESKFKNVVNIEFTCERFDDNITITNIDNPNNIDITEEYLNNYKDLVKKHLDEYISACDVVKEYFINKGMSYYKENVSIKNC